MKEKDMDRYEYRPNTCEWNEGCKCRLPTLRNTSYCEIHYPQVYRVMTDEEVDELVNTELTRVRNAPSTEILDDE